MESRDCRDYWMVVHLYSLGRCWSVPFVLCNPTSLCLAEGNSWRPSLCHASKASDSAAPVWRGNEQTGGRVGDQAFGFKCLEIWIASLRRMLTGTPITHCQPVVDTKTLAHYSSMVFSPQIPVVSKCEESHGGSVPNPNLVTVRLTHVSGDHGHHCSYSWNNQSDDFKRRLWIAPLQNAHSGAWMTHNTIFSNPQHGIAWQKTQTRKQETHKRICWAIAIDRLQHIDHYWSIILEHRYQSTRSILQVRDTWTKKTHKTCVVYLCLRFVHDRFMPQTM